MKHGLGLVLHAHLPFVLNHGTWPHGADWLNEAAAETYVPLLLMMRNLERDGVPWKLNLGLTPVLCEQLASDEFRKEFAGYLEAKIVAADQNAVEFSGRGEHDLAALARRWQGYYQSIREAWLHQWNGDLLAGFNAYRKSGHLEILTCCATHGYLPLLGRDGAADAQLRTAVATHRRHFGVDPRGIWLPECAYRPRYRWSPPVGARWTATMRQGVEELLAAHGLKFFIADTHLVRGGRAVGLYLERFNELRKLWARFERETGKPMDTDRSPHRPYWVATEGKSEHDRDAVAVFARDPDTGVVVWSGEHGYPGDGAYLDFHKKHHPGGLRYWRVTRPKSELHEKELYEPDKIESRLDENAEHFITLAGQLLKGGTGDGPRTLTAPYDAELFGHWWFEGVRWLEKVIRKAAERADLETVRLGDVLDQHPPEEAIALPEGSWGQGGFHWIWLNENTSWSWDRIYVAEDRMEKLSGEMLRREAAGVPGTQKLRQILTVAAKELLILESSDWQFLISTVSARDYAELRLQRHGADFSAVASIADLVLTGRQISAEQQSLIDSLATRDFLFRDIDPAWWGRTG